MEEEKDSTWENFESASSLTPEVVFGSEAISKFYRFMRKSYHWVGSVVIVDRLTGKIVEREFFAMQREDGTETVVSLRDDGRCFPIFVVALFILEEADVSWCMN